MKIRDEDLFSIHLKARNLSEASLVCGYTSPSDRSYVDRMKRVEDEAADLMRSLRDHVMIGQAIDLLGGIDGAVEVRAGLIAMLEGK